MRGFSKTVALLAVSWALGACTFKDAAACKENADCKSGSFCLKDNKGNKEGLCSFGELTDDEHGTWAILPKVVLSLWKPVNQKPKHLELTSTLEPDRGSDTGCSKKIRFSIIAYGADTILKPSLKPSGNNEVKVECEETVEEEFSMTRDCSLTAYRKRVYELRVDVENSNGTNTLSLDWKVESDRFSGCK